MPRKRRRASPVQHIRRLRSGKRVLVSKGVKRRRRSWPSRGLFKRTLIYHDNRNDPQAIKRISRTFTETPSEDVSLTIGEHSFLINKEGLVDQGVSLRDLKKRARRRPQRKVKRRMALNLTRVPFGRKDTPLEDREFRIDNRGPVGTIKEYQKTFPDEILIINDPISKSSREIINPMRFKRRRFTDDDIRSGKARRLAGLDTSSGSIWFNARMGGDSDFIAQKKAFRVQNTLGLAEGLAEQEAAERINDEFGDDPEFMPEDQRK